MFRKSAPATRNLVTQFLKAQGFVAFVVVIGAALLAFWMLAWAMAYELEYSATERAEQTIARALAQFEPGQRPLPDSALPQITAQPSEWIYLDANRPVPQATTALGQALSGLALRIGSADGNQYEHTYLDASLSPARNIWTARWLLIGTAQPFENEITLYLMQSLIEEQRFVVRITPVLWAAGLFVACVTLLAFVVSFARFAKSTQQMVRFLDKQATVLDLSLDRPSGVVPALNDIRDAALRAFVRLDKNHKRALQVIHDMPHDFGNTAARLSAQISNAGDTPSPDVLQSALSEAAMRFRELSEFQSELYSSSLEAEVRDLGVWLKDHLQDDLNDEPDDNDLSLSASLPTGLKARFNDAALATILDNLHDNAMKYTASPATLRFAVLQIDGATGLRITTSPSLAATLPPDAAFGQRWVRGAEASGSRGSGFGLFRIRKMMEMMEGHADFRMIEPQGSAPRMFEVTLRFAS